MKALILAGGLGTRLREIIIDRPKGMAPIDGKPFLEYLIKQLKNQGIIEIVISTGFLPETIINYFGNGERFNVKLFYSDENIPLGTAGAVKNAEGFFQEKFLVLNGDTFLDLKIPDFLKFHQEKKADISIALNKPFGHIAFGSVLLNKDNKITAFEEKKVIKKSFVNCGFYILEPKIFSLIPKGRRTSLEKNIFPKALKQGFRIYGFPVMKKYYDIGTPKGYKTAKLVLPKILTKREIVVQAPMRISFLGGGTDLPEFYKHYRGCVLSVAINKYIRVKIKPYKKNYLINLKDYNLSKEYPRGKPLPYNDKNFDIIAGVLNRYHFNNGLEITIESDVPASSGLGTSSAMTVALIKGLSYLKGEDLTKEEIAQLAVEIERKDLAILGGKQDQYASAYGGINYIQFLENEKVIIQPLELNKELTKKFLNRLLLLYIPRYKKSGELQKSLIKNIRSNKESVVALKKLKKLVFEAESCLLNSRFDEFGKILDTGFNLKIKSNPEIIKTNPQIQEVYRLALKYGGIGGKILGAGSGGFMLILAKAGSINKLKTKVEEKGYIFYNFSFDFEGVKVNYEN